MKTYLDCVPCFLRQGLEAARLVTDDIDTHERVVRQVLRMTAELKLDRPPPVVGQAIHRLLRELTGIDDPYLTSKRRHNQLALELLPELTREVDRAQEPMLAAARLAIAANMIDLGVTGTLAEAEVRDALKRSIDQPIVTDWAALQHALDTAREILYLADNAGEIVFDRLLIEQLGAQRVTLAVRGAPVINDATRADAREARLGDLVEVIDNGSDVPGTLLDECSAAFLERFRRADLIIAKGQGNYETLSEVEGNIFFLFKVKCPVIATHAGLPVGTHAVLKSRGKTT